MHYWGQQRGILEDKEKNYLSTETMTQMVWFFLVVSQKRGQKVSLSPYLSGFEIIYLTKMMRQSANVDSHMMQAFYQYANDDLDQLVSDEIRKNCLKINGKSHQT